MAYKINRLWSIGGGVRAQYLDAELNQAIDYGTINAALGFGTSYQFSDRLGFDLSYTYITMVDDAEIDKTATGKDTFRGALKGEYDGWGSIMGLQISYKF